MVQVFLDVEALSSELTRLGVDLSTVETFAKLLTMVNSAREERGLSAASQEAM